MVKSFPLLAVLACSVSCAGREPAFSLERKGDEIAVCGKFFHVGTRVVLWFDPGGYDAYRVERRFAPVDGAEWKDTRGLDSPNRYGSRREGMSTGERQARHGGNWTLDGLREKVDQFVIHYDACGSSRRCFQVLHDQRGLSVHFLLDLDGTIYQTLDLKERAWHATISNCRSVGIEIANGGACPAGTASRLNRFYDGTTNRLLVDDFAREGLKEPRKALRPARPGMIEGEIQGTALLMVDLTEAQYEALIRLTAALCRVFPRIECDAPRDGEGKVSDRVLSPDAWRGFRGILGHCHVQENKVDPGPAFQWERVLSGARRLLDR